MFVQHKMTMKSHMLASSLGIVATIRIHLHFIASVKYKDYIVSQPGSTRAQHTYASCVYFKKSKVTIENSAFLLDCPT